MDWDGSRGLEHIMMSQVRQKEAEKGQTVRGYFEQRSTAAFAEVGLLSLFTIDL